MTGSIPITLPGGYWRNGVRQQDAFLRPLSGRDELFLLESGEGLSPAQRTTAIVARCLDLSEEAARELTAGDREAVLLHLRRATFGETLTSVLRCPHRDCDEQMDLELRVGDLLVDATPDAAPVHETRIGEHTVRFRLPNGKDLEEAAAIATRDRGAAVRHVLERCVEGSGGAPFELLLAELPARMAALDPQAELVLNLTCTRCGRAFTALFDTASFLFGELATHRKSLYREIHELAFHYHWSESEILGMTAARRRRYLDLLAEALAPRGKR